MIKLTYKDKSYQLPESVDDMALWQWQALCRCTEEGNTDTLSLMSALSGMSKTALANSSSGQVEFYDQILASFAPQIAMLIESEPPEYVVYGSIKIKPKAWPVCTVGQRIAMRSEVGGKNWHDVMHIAIAIAIAPIIFPDDWAEQYKGIAEGIKLMPAKEMVPLGFFLPAKLMGMRIDGQNRYSLPRTLHLRLAVRTLIGSTFGR